MKIITLLENSSTHQDCICEHGLSIYIETKKHKLLVDTGASDAFLSNAKVLGIDLRQVDTVILSHGHYDHSGGIMSFAQLNPHANIYMQKSAIGDYYDGEEYIGMDKRIQELSQVHFLEGDVQIDEELAVFTHVTGRRFWPQSNLGLNKWVNGEVFQDEFDHEQCLVVTQGEQRILFSGCAHNGILNLLDRFKEIYGEMPQVVISGFHMMKKTAYTKEEEKVIINTAQELCKMNTIFYTGHCTGNKAYDLMRPIMGEKLQLLHSGEKIM